MLKTAASKVAWVSRTASMVFALAVLLAGCSGETAGSGTQEEKAASAAPPKAKDDHATTVEEREVQIKMVANDSGESLEIGRMKPGQAHGDIICEAPMQSCAYTPEKGFSGKAKFSYVVRDAKGRSDSAMVYVRVKPAN